MSKHSEKKSELYQTPLSKCPTGIKGFDEITKGGLPQNRTTLVSGDPGFPVHDCVHKPAPKAETHLMGWECPRCHKIHSPFVTECSCAPITITTISNPEIKEEVR